MCRQDSGRAMHHGLNNGCPVCNRNTGGKELMHFEKKASKAAGSGQAFAFICSVHGNVGFFPSLDHSQLVLF